VSRLKKHIRFCAPILAIAIFWLLCGSCFLGLRHTRPDTGCPDTWILIFAVYDRGGRQRFVLADLGQFTRVVSYSLAAIIGIGLGILIGTNKMMSKALDPIFQLLRTVPPLAWPFLWWQPCDKKTAALFVIFITAIWPILINTAVGETNFPRLQQRCQSFTTFRKEYFFIPHSCCLLHFFTGLRIAVGLVGDYRSRNCYVRYCRHWLLSGKSYQITTSVR